MTAVGACLLAASAGLTYNGVVHDRAQLSPAGSTFLMANLIAQGPARAELLATCPDARYRLCAHLEELTDADTMLWEGVIMQRGGFPAFSDESRRLVWATFAHRPGAVIAMSASSTARALMTVNPTAEVTPLPDYVRRIVGEVYGAQEERRYVAAAQARGTFPRALPTLLVYAGLITAIVVITAMAVSRQGAGMTFPTYVTAAFLGNALVCATLSGVHDRYQSRVSWLFVLAATALLVDRSRSLGGVPAVRQAGLSATA